MDNNGSFTLSELKKKTYEMPINFAKIPFGKHLRCKLFLNVLRILLSNIQI